VIATSGGRVPLRGRKRRKIAEVDEKGFVIVITSKFFGSRCEGDRRLLIPFCAALAIA